MEKINEDTLCSQVILPLLQDAGFAGDDVELEHSFHIRLGRSVYRVRSGAGARSHHDDHPPRSTSGAQGSADR